MESLPATRKEAKRLGEMFYFTGAPCSKGGIAKRLTSTGSCRCEECSALRLEGKRKAKREAYGRDPERFRRESRDYYASNVDAIKPKMAKYRESIREWQAQYNREYRQANKERLAAMDREWRSRNPHHVAMRRMLYRVIQAVGGTKQARTHEILGYSPSDLRLHMERQFLKGMNWDNYGEWHIDHIVSVSELVANGETDPAVINCLTNLRPIWAEDNLSKGSKRETLL